MSTDSRPLRQPGLIVYACGLGTSVLVLWIVNALNEAGTNVMGWYANGILPIGALLVGAGSGVGYAVASRYMQVKPSRAFVYGMLTTAVIDYAAAQYITYTNLLEQAQIPADAYGFTDYIRDICERMTFQRNGDQKPGNPLGIWGYLFKVLEISGYAFGAMCPVMIVSRMPYCKACQRFLKPHRTGILSSTANWREIKPLGKKEREAALQAAIGELGARVEQVVARIAQGSLAETTAEIEALDRAAAEGTAARMAFTLTKCPTCDSHHVQLQLHHWTVDKKQAHGQAGAIDKTAPDEVA